MSPQKTYRGWEFFNLIVRNRVKLSLGAIPQERAMHYRAWVRGAIPEGEWEGIRQAIQQGQ